jgi:tetratricopeptide (TPR) repeat protein
VAVAEAYVRAAPGDIFAISSLSVATGVLADEFTDQKQYEKAIPLREKTEQLARKALELGPADVAASRNLALAEKKLGALYGVTGRFQQCREEYERALKIDADYVARNSGDTRSKLDLSYDYSDLGWVAGRLGRYDDGLGWNRQALALREEAARADPRDARAAVAVASSTNRIGKLFRNKEEFDKALVELQNALALYEKLAEKASPDWQTVRDLAEAHVDLADTLVQMGDRKSVSASQRQAWRARAAGEYRKSRELYAGLKTRGVLPKVYYSHIAELQALEDGLKPAAP